MNRPANWGELHEFIMDHLNQFDINDSTREIVANEIVYAAKLVAQSRDVKQD